VCPPGAATNRLVTWRKGMMSSAPTARQTETAAMDDQLTEAALDYHRLPTPGKISILPTKGLTNQRDLALAYSPGVAAACLAIERDPRQAHNLTARGNLAAVITNGTAV